MDNYSIKPHVPLDVRVKNDEEQYEILPRTGSDSNFPID